MSIAAQAHAKLDIGRVISRAVEVLQRNWRSLVRPALLFLYLPGVIVGALQPTAGPFGPGRAGAAVPFVGLLALIPYALFHGGLIRLTVADLNAEAISTDEAMRTGRERMWPMFGLLLLTGLAVGLGLLLLVAPGVYAALAWSVVSAVLIEERRPVMQTYGRSAELTRGSRLNILGLALILVLFDIVVGAVLGLLGAPFPGLFANALIAPLENVVAGVAGGVLAATIYDELRALHGGRSAAPLGA